MMEASLKLLSLVRAVVYLAVTVESVFLSYLYWNAYKNFKPTPIINSLVLLLLSIGVNFFYLTIVALIFFVGYIEIYKIMVAFIPLTTIFLLASLRRFADESVRVKKKNKNNFFRKIKKKL